MTLRKLAVVLTTAVIAALALGSPAAAQTPLQLSDFDDSGLDVDFAALITAGNSTQSGGTALYATAAGGWTATGTLEDGELGVGDTDALISRIMWAEDYTFENWDVLRFNDNPSPFDMGAYFDDGGDGEDLTLYLQTDAGTDPLTCDANSTIVNEGENWTNWECSAAFFTLLSGIQSGDRFIIAAARPSATPPTPTGEQTMTYTEPGTYTLDVGGAVSVTVSGGGGGGGSGGGGGGGGGGRTDGFQTSGSGSPGGSGGDGEDGEDGASTTTAFTYSGGGGGGGEAGGDGGDSTVSVMGGSTLVTFDGGGGGDGGDGADGRQIRNVAGGLGGSGGDGPATSGNGAAGGAGATAGPCGAPAGGAGSAGDLATTHGETAYTIPSGSTLTIVVGGGGDAGNAGEGGRGGGGYGNTCAGNDGTDGTAGAAGSVTVKWTPNTAPTVTVSADVTTVDGGGTVTLTGSATDAEGNELTYSWTASPDVGTFASTTVATTTWVAPAAEADDQTVTLTLTANDGSLEGSDDVTITVRGNRPPTVSASADVSAVDGGGTVTLTASATDPDGNTITYSWAAAPDVGSFADDEAASTTWTAPAATTSNQDVTFTVTASDGALTDTDTASVTVRAIPHAPDAPTLVASNGQIAVTWTAPTNEGPAINDYDIQFRAGDSGAWTAHTHTGTATSSTIPNLENGTSYQVQVRANSPAGMGAWSNAASATPSTAPLAPDEPDVVPGDGQVAVSWTAPESGGSEITDYDIRYREGISGTWMDHPHTGLGTSATISGLVNGRSYEVEVRANSEAGMGAWSQATTAVPAMAAQPTAPAAPEPPNLTGGGGQIEVAWVEPANGGAAITSYDVQYRSTLGIAWTTSSVTTSPTTIMGLVAGQAYEFQVRAVNSQGAGGWSLSTVGTPLAPGSVQAVDFPLVSLLRTAVELGIDYTGTPSASDSVVVSGDSLLSLSADCEETSATFTPPPETVDVYPCETGTGSVSVRYGADEITWVKSTQVLSPRYSFDVTVTTTAASTQTTPTVLWRTVSWPLYRDSLIEEGTVVVVEEGAGGRLSPLNYQEPGDTTDAATVLVCNDGAASCSGSTLWSDPPEVGDQVYFLHDAPFAMVYVTVGTEGSRETPWVVDWHYSTATGWEALPRPQDSTEGLRTSGPVMWDELDDPPMAARIVESQATAMYAVRATLASTGTGTFTRPVVSSAGTQSGYWSAQLEGDLAPGAATTLRVYVLPLDTVAVGDFRRVGPPQSLVVTPPTGIETDVGPWRPWTAPSAPTTPAQRGSVFTLPDNIQQPIDEEGGLPLIGWAVRGASTAAGVPPLVLWTMIGMAIAFAVLVATQKATDNIMISVVAGGLVLTALTTPTIGLSALWVILVYGLIGGAAVVIGRRMPV